jgi:hypothetical protein
VESSDGNSPLSFRERAYIRQHNLRAVAMTVTGRVYTTEDPQGALCCFWCRADAANELAERVWRGESADKAARALKIKLLPHPYLGGAANRKFPVLPPDLKAG